MVKVTVYIGSENIFYTRCFKSNPEKKYDRKASKTKQHGDRFGEITAVLIDS